MIKKELSRETTRTETGKRACSLVAWVIMTLALLLPLGLSAAETGTLYIDGAPFTTVSDFQTAINAKLQTGAAQVEVTGAMQDVATATTLAIPMGKKVVWTAQYEAASGFNGNLVTLSGSGTFEVAAGGALNAQGGYAIYSSSTTEATVLISGGTVSSSEKAAINSYNTKTNITVSGGTVSGKTGAISYNGFGLGVSLTINGGTVVSQSGAAINTDGYSENFTINVTGGTIVSHKSYAVNLGGSGSAATVSGGTLFGSYTGYPPTLNSVISVNGTLFTGPTGTGTVILWDNSTGQTKFKPDATDKLNLWPSGATAKWDIVGGKQGVSYVNGTKSGFIEVLSAKVLTDAVSISNTMTAADIKMALEDALSLYNIQLRAAGTSIVGDVTITAITPATAGTESAPNGVNGWFTFSVSLARGSATAMATFANGVVIATPHASTPLKRIEVLYLGNLKARILNTGNIATGDLTLALSGTNADVFTISQATVNSLAAGSEADITLIPRANLAAGTYMATLTVSGDGIAESVTVTYTVTPTGIDNPQAKVLKAYVQNGTLHASGLIAGNRWAVYSISGALVYQGIATGDEADVSLSVRGVYIVKSGNKTVKVIY